MKTSAVLQRARPGVITVLDGPHASIRRRVDAGSFSSRVVKLLTQRDSAPRKQSTDGATIAALANGAQFAQVPLRSGPRALPRRPAVREQLRRNERATLLISSSPTGRVR
jgi:hypothetical protein